MARWARSGRVLVALATLTMVVGCQTFHRLAAGLGLVTEAGLDWQASTDKLNAAIKGGASSDAAMQQQVPELVAMVKADATNPQIFQFWGTSINYDEGAKGEIVMPDIVAAIGRMAGQPMVGRNVHAGLMHTYGYLVSNLVTPYGYKRERWTLPTIDEGLGWTHGPISPTPKQGTLLTNVTALAGKIAFRDDAQRLSELEQATTSAAPEIRGLNVNSLSIKRLVEQISMPPSDAKKVARTVTIRTDLVRLPHVQAGDKALTHLLVYSIQDSALGGSRLITAFPMTEAAATAVLQPDNLGPRKPVITRYNAYVPGITGTKLEGSRSVMN